MQALQYVEIDIDYCSLRYGQTTAAGTCPAVLGVDSPIKCFNTLKTCPDSVRPSFTNVPLTLRFAIATAYLPNSIEAIPSIKSISFSPATISLGKNLGQRAAITVTFEDHRHSDTGLDPYLSDRPYDPFLQGSFFGKFRARVPYLRGRPLRWINGQVGQNFADMERRYYIIDSFSGPNNNGEYSIVAKDVLKLADGDRAMAPLQNTGFLLADITNVATSATLRPIGIGNTEYPASGLCAIGGNEICSFTRAGDALTLTRAQLNTEAATHSAQDRVQVVLTYSGQDPAIIIQNLLQTYAGISPSYIPIAEWTLETSTYLNRLYSANIADPTAVVDLVSELIEQAGLILWWRDRQQTIGLQVLRGATSEAELLTQDNVIADSVDIAEQPDKRLSSVSTYYGQINPLGNLTDKANFRSVAVLTDDQAESDYGSPAIQEIFSRWIPIGGRTTADRINSLLLARFTDPPRHFKFKCLRNTTSDLMLAQIYNLMAWPVQDDTGAAEVAPIQITRLKPMADVIELEGDEMLFTAPAENLINRTIIIDSNTLNFNAKATHDALFPPASSGDAVTIIINAGVIVGDGGPGAAFDTGVFPAGVSVTLEVNGRIQGQGGDGGFGGDAFVAGVGGDGGTALRAQVPISLKVASGQIWGGGGGGGGGTNPGGAGGAGGGGAGQLPGHGGTGLLPGADGTTEAGGATGGGPFPGGAGGGPGQAGGTTAVSRPGGAAGVSINGLSNVTFATGSLAANCKGPTIP